VGPGGGVREEVSGRRCPGRRCPPGGGVKDFREEVSSWRRWEEVRGDEVSGEEVGRRWGGGVGRRCQGLLGRAPRGIRRGIARCWSGCLLEGE
jgi:hypothetical protein